MMVQSRVSSLPAVAGWLALDSVTISGMEAQYDGLRDCSAPLHGILVLRFRLSCRQIQAFYTPRSAGHDSPPRASLRRLFLPPFFSGTISPDCRSFPAGRPPASPVRRKNVARAAQPFPPPPYRKPPCRYQPRCPPAPCCKTQASPSAPSPLCIPARAVGAFLFAPQRSRHRALSAFCKRLPAPSGKNPHLTTPPEMNASSPSPSRRVLRPTPGTASPRLRALPLRQMRKAPARPLPSPSQSPFRPFPYEKAAPALRRRRPSSPGKRRPT